MKASVSVREARSRRIHTPYIFKNKIGYCDLKIKIIGQMKWVKFFLILIRMYFL